MGDTFLEVKTPLQQLQVGYCSGGDQEASVSSTGACSRSRAPRAISWSWRVGAGQANFRVTPERVTLEKVMPVEL